MNTGDSWTEVSVEELYQLIWEKPIHTLSKEFGVSDVGLAKICKRNGIPRPERGYWARLYSGQKIKTPPLPKSAKRNHIIRITKTETIEIPAENISTPRPLIVPDTLSDAHPLMEITRKYARFDKKEASYVSFQEKVRCLNIHTTRSTFERALRIMDATIKALEWEGMQVIINERGGTCIVADNGEHIEFSIREALKKEQTALDPIEDRFSISIGRTHRTDYVPSGKLHLELDGHTGVRSRWRDTDKRPLEKALGDFTICVQKTGIALRQRHLEWEEWHRLREEEAQLRREEERKETELEQQLTNFRYTETLSRYIHALRNGIVSATGRKPEGKAAEWLAWLESRVKTYDPVQAYINRHMLQNPLEEDEDN